MTNPSSVYIQRSGGNVSGYSINPQADPTFDANPSPWSDAGLQAWLTALIPAPSFKLAASDFLLRFTPTERANVRAQPALADYVMQLQTVRYVDLLDNLVPTAMDALISFGIIDSTRKSAVLNPVLGPTETLVSG